MLVEAAKDGDTGLAEDVGDLSFAEAGGVVFERDMTFGVVDLETAEAVRVGKFTERTELIVGERGLEFEFGFEECHSGIIAKRGSEERRCRVGKTSGARRSYRRKIIPLPGAARQPRVHGRPRYFDQNGIGEWSELKTRDLTSIGDRSINRGRGYRR